MDNNKLIKLLKTLTKKEWRDFSKFVESPYFNTDKQCVQLLAILTKELTRNSGTLSRERLEKQFFKSSKKDAAQLNVKLSLLTRLAEQFLMQQNFESKDLHRKHTLLESLLQRDLRSHFESVYKKDSKLHKSPEKVSLEFYREKFLVEYDFSEYVSSGSKKIHVHENLQEVSDTLDTSYILTKIHLFCAMTSLMKLYQKDYNLSSLEMVESIACLPQFKNHPVISVYFTAYQMLRNSHENSYFKDLKDLLYTNGGMIKSFDLHNLYILSANYCVDKIRNGHIEYHYELHSLYRQMEEAGLLLYKEYIDIGMLKNIISAAAKIKEFDWAEYIIEKYKDNIEPNIQGDVHSYFLASIAFYKEDFEGAISCLSDVKSINSTFDLNIKFILMKAYYEQDTEFSYYTEQVFRSFKVFVKQNKVFSKERKERLINFANSVNNLYRVKHHEGRATIESVVKKIEDYELLADKKWLKEKIEILKSTPVRRFR